MSALNKIKRPIAWPALFLTGMVTIVLNICVNNLEIPRISPAEGYVIGKVSDIEKKNGSTYLYLKNISFSGENTKELTDIKNSSLLTFNSGCVCILDDANVHIGENVTVAGKISVFEKARNPGEFDSRKYYISKGYLFRASACSLKKNDGRKDLIKNTAYETREKIAGILDKTLSEKDAGMMKAILLSDKTDLDRDIKNLYKDAGEGHLLAISGLHITLFAAFILFILKKTPMNLDAAYIITIVILFAYGYMIGFSASALRAIIMFTILSVGKMCKKSYDTITAMAAASFLTVCFKPLYVLQTGFLMSYAAIVGIALVLPAFTSIGKRDSKVFSTFFMSISVSLTSLPVLIDSYYKIPLYSTILNIILVPGMSILLALGILCVFTGFILPKELNVFAYLIHFLLIFYEILMKLELSIPKAVITTGARGIVRCVIYESVLIAACVFYRKTKIDFWRKNRLITNKIRLKEDYNPTGDIRRNKRKRALFSLILFIVLSSDLFFLLYFKRDNRIEFLDVGQGLCACIQYDGGVYCFDGGSTDRSGIYEYVLLPYFSYYGISDIDAWFVSHEDADHASGVADAIRNNKTGEVKVEEVIIPLALKHNFKEVFKDINSERTKTIYAAKGDVFKTDCGDGISFEILSPMQTPFNSDSNANSLAVLVKTKEGNILFTGDSDTNAEELIIEYFNVNASTFVDILQIAHHGSANNTNTKEFLQKVNPKISVISCGFKNRYNHPHKETMDNLQSIKTRILRTDYDGCISIKLD